MRPFGIVTSQNAAISESLNAYGSRVVAGCNRAAMHQRDTARALITCLSLALSGAAGTIKDAKVAVEGPRGDSSARHKAQIFRPRNLGTRNSNRATSWRRGANRRLERSKVFGIAIKIRGTIQRGCTVHIIKQYFRLPKVKGTGTST